MSELKALKIKCDVVQRLRKDLELYHAEAEQQRQHIARMLANGGDPYDVRKQVSAAPRTASAELTRSGSKRCSTSRSTCCPTASSG